MALDSAMMSRLDGIRRSYRALTERLGDPDVIADSGLLRRVMQDRSRSEDVVSAFDEYCRLDEELSGARELFQEAGDDAEMREMARTEMRNIESELEALEGTIKILSLPKDPNDERNCMLEIRAGTGGSEANIFAGEWPPTLYLGRRRTIVSTAQIYKPSIVCLFFLRTQGASSLTNVAHPSPSPNEKN
jgi:peptide chain release factor 1